MNRWLNEAKRRASRRGDLSSEFQTVLADRPEIGRQPIDDIYEGEVRGVMKLFEPVRRRENSEKRSCLEKVPGLLVIRVYAKFIAT